MFAFSRYKNNQVEIVKTNLNIFLICVVMSTHTHANANRRSGRPFPQFCCWGFRASSLSILLVFRGGQKKQVRELGLSMGIHFREAGIFQQHLRPFQAVRCRVPPSSPPPHMSSMPPQQGLSIPAHGRLAVCGQRDLLTSALAYNLSFSSGVAS